ncbi:MAG: TolC family protein [Bacteroidales bacterium]|nr:TolC family protein [Bacteroidales bacterium]
MIKKTITIVLILIGSKTLAQDINVFLDKVKDHHPGIVAAEQLLYSREKSAETGYMPPDPSVSFGYFPGQPESIGNKVTWSVDQSFDFPTSYYRIKELKRKDFELAELQYRLAVLNLMQQVREKVIEKIAIDKKIDLLGTRLKDLREMKKAYDKMLAEGEATVIAFNRVTMELVEMETTYNQYLTTAENLRSFLDLVSGNNSELVEGSSYPFFGEPVADSLLDIKKIQHPEFLIPAKEASKASMNIQVVRSEKLPEIRIGIASEIIGTERFTGPSMGLTIPLWEDHRKVSEARAFKTHTEAKNRNKKVMLENKLRSDIKTYQNLDRSLSVLQNVLEGSESYDYLRIALEEGQISIIEYFNELKTYYDIEDRIIETEKKCLIMQSRLFDHQLVPGKINN